MKSSLRSDEIREHLMKSTPLNTTLQSRISLRKRFHPPKVDFIRQRRISLRVLLSGEHANLIFFVILDYLASKNYSAGVSSSAGASSAGASSAGASSAAGASAAGASAAGASAAGAPAAGLLKSARSCAKVFFWMRNQ